MIVEVTIYKLFFNNNLLFLGSQLSPVRRTDKVGYHEAWWQSVSKTKLELAKGNKLFRNTLISFVNENRNVRMVTLVINDVLIKKMFVWQNIFS